MDRKVYPVSQVNRYVKALLEQNPVLSSLWIRGEISNFKRHSSGHLYFTIKDADGALSAVMFRSYTRSMNFAPSEGMRVVCFGQVSLYEKTGQYQCYVKEMEPDGTGALYEAYEKLKKRLEMEGLFREETKQRIPPYARTIGIVTSLTGAAVRDMIQIAKRRYPGIRILLAPAIVQGGEAAASIVHAIGTLNRDGRAEVLLVGRGGGSLEDLWAFNEEAVVRAIAASRIPVISAVGHETDYTLSDFAADLRAPTPSAAAELAVPDAYKVLKDLDETRRQLSQKIRYRKDAYAKQISVYRDHKAGRMLHMHVREQMMDVAAVTDEISRSFRQQLEFKRRQVEDFQKKHSFGTLQYQSETARQSLVYAESILQKAMNRRRNDVRKELILLQEGLKLRDPKRPLGKGYSFLFDESGVIRSTHQLSKGQRVLAVLSDGQLGLTVEDIIKEGPEEHENRG